MVSQIPPAEGHRDPCPQRCHSRFYPPISRTGIITDFLLNVTFERGLPHEGTHMYTLPVQVWSKLDLSLTTGHAAAQSYINYKSRVCLFWSNLALTKLTGYMAISLKHYLMRRVESGKKQNNFTMYLFHNTVPQDSI